MVANFKLQLLLLKAYINTAKEKFKWFSHLLLLCEGALKKTL